MYFWLEIRAKKTGKTQRQAPFKKNKLKCRAAVNLYTRSGYLKHMIFA